MLAVVETSVSLTCSRCNIRLPVTYWVWPQCVRKTSLPLSVLNLLVLILLRCFSRHLLFLFFVCRSPEDSFSHPAEGSFELSLARPSIPLRSCHCLSPLFLSLESFCWITYFAWPKLLSEAAAIFHCCWQSTNLPSTYACFFRHLIGDPPCDFDPTAVPKSPPVFPLISEKIVKVFFCMRF